MKNKRTFLLLSVVVATLLLTVAYAAIGNITLNVSGNAVATPDQANFNVHFTGTPTKTGNGTITPKITGNTSATLNVTGLTKKGEKLTATFTIKNSSADLKATLKATTTQTNNDYFSISSALGKTSLSPAGTTTLTITVELIKTPITSNVTNKITVNVTATPTN